VPNKPAHPCAYSGCPNLTHGRFCERHSQTENARYNKYQRDPKINKRYGSAWSRISKAYRKTHPLCEKCQCEGRLTPAALVHHIKPLSEGGTHDRANLMALCDSCHSAIHSDRWGRT